MARPIALITGASSGIGADLAREAAKDGYDIVLSARRVDAMLILARELETYGAATTILAADLSKPGGVENLTDEIDRRGLDIELLINNAGLGANGPFVKSDITRIDEMLQVNIVALTRLTRLILPAMVARKRGRVMLLASTASFQPGPQMAVYCATKAYVLSFGEAIAYELRDSGVTVTTVCPGATATDFARVAGTENIALHRGATSNVMKSADVARIGYRGTKAGRRVVITGLMNRVMAITARVSPHAMVLPIANSMMSTK
jgi:short-subunit dehydrogenase